MMCDTQEAIDSRLLELHKGATSQVSLLTEGTHSIPCAASSGNSEELLNSMSGDRPWSIEGGPDDPICIVGLGIVPDRKLIRQSLTFLACHLPGGVRSPSSLWDLLLAKRTAQGLVPPERFNIQGFHGLDDSRAGAMAADGGYFLEDDVRLFENSFFHINNIEATYMDPLQRKLLEVVFECFENAGASLDQMSGSNTGVYTGDFTTDYQTMHSKDPDYLHRYSTTGAGKAILANRISHVFNLQGPSLTMNTACSSSMYCLHAAISAVKAGDCDSAIVAAANLIMAPEQHLETMKGGVLSATSTCKTFDASADGYGRAEGVNAVYIKRLSSALRDNDKVWGVIRATALNANGKTPGISQPSADLQEAVIRKAYANAGLAFADTDYIECHGTGTAVGDVVEVNALKRCFCPRDGPPLMIGSVKTNLGHSEAASGLTSLIKVLLAFENDTIPPTHGVAKLNPRLELDSTRIKVVTQEERWPRSLRRASINSFGYGGANAHAIVESLDSYLGSQPTCYEPIADTCDNLLVLPISAASSKSLEARISQLSTLVEGCSSTYLGKLAFTLSERRSNFRSKTSLLAQINVNGHAKVLLTQIPEAIQPVSSYQLPFAFIFTGQGAQYPCMGKELLLHNDNFRTTIQELDSVLQSLPAELAPTWTLKQAIMDPPSTSKVNEVTYSQPMCTSLQIGLVNVLKSWNIHPSVVIGHSSGEITAAYAAGLLTQSEAIIVAYLRGFAVARLRRQGAMLAAGIDVLSAENLIQRRGLSGEITVACDNAPESVTLSGSLASIDILSSELQGQKRFCRKLETGGRAYHSHMMNEIGSYYETLIAPYLKRGKKAQAQDSVSFTTKMFSSMGLSGNDLGCLTRKTNMARYWRDNLENPVQFNEALKTLKASGDYHFVEIGPHHALKGPVQQILASYGSDKRSLPYNPSLIRNEDSNIAMKKLAASLFHHGHVLNWREINNLPGGIALQPLHNLPAYPWDYSARLLWHEPRASVELRNRRYVRHELLGSQNVAGNDIDWSWRNIIRLDEVPWIRDHKVEAHIVFPAAGYLAMAIEAISQMRGLKDQSSSSPRNNWKYFELCNVSINTAFVVQSDGQVEGATEDTELHTVMSPRRLSVTSESTDWHDFSISSWAMGQAIVHCVGSIRVNGASKPKGTVTVDSTGYETWSMKRWYEKLKDHGLCFGPQFQSLTSLSTDSIRTRSDAVSTVQLGTSYARHSDTKYIMHPVTIDACFQTAVLGAASGSLSSLQAYLPVFISECRIQHTCINKSNQQAQIHVHTTVTSTSTQKVDCMMRSLDDTILVDMKGVRLSLYTGKVIDDRTNQSSAEPQRNPCLRVHWKPDIFRLPSGAENHLNEYIAKFIKHQDPDIADNKTLSIMAALIELAGHKNPGMEVLELDSSCNCKSKQWLDLLNKDTAFPRCRAWQTSSLLDKGGISSQSGSQGPFDVVIIHTLSSSKRYWKESPTKILSMVKDNGVIISRATDEAELSLCTADFTVARLEQDIILAVKIPERISRLIGRSLLIIFREHSPYVDELISSISSSVQVDAGISEVSSIAISDIATAGVNEKTVCVSLLEVETEFLATMQQHEMDLLRSITNVVDDLLWITGANVLDISGQANPNLTLASGLSRTLMLEQPSLRFSVVDIGPAHHFKQNIPLACESIISALVPLNDVDDKEFIYSNGLLYISRFGPDPALNQRFRRRLGMDDQLHRTTLSNAGLARFSIDKVGHSDTIYFQQLREPFTEPPPGFVDIAIRAVSLNAKDIYTSTGRVETRRGTTAFEFSGVITATARDVSNMKPGDPVVALWPCHFKTVERVPAWAVHKLLPDEEYTTMTSIPVAYSTALYALYDRACLRNGESVLIHSGSGALGIAAISIAQRVGATVYTTVGSPAKKEFLMAEFGLPESHIFSSRDSSFVDGLMELTSGRGVDIVINSLVGDLMHSSWECVSNFGRFVEVGKRELVDAGRLNMRGFLRNATFTAFDIEEMVLSEHSYHRKVIASKVKEALELYREGNLRIPPVTTFDIADISRAHRYFSTKDRVGKVVISLENPKSQIQVYDPKYSTVLDPEKIYLLVGCLGGLGRSLSRWMIGRGARYFVFLGRSGCDRPDAQKLVSSLHNAGASVTVLKGDVSALDDVDAAIKACKSIGKPIGGVIQAAMGLRESIFSNMTSEAWHIGVDCKWAGTWNLHHALEAYDEGPDFFLMTSSNSGSVGVATEANYCASNGFMDAFSRWRRSQGKPAVSIGLGMISEVGYLHENPDIGAILSRRGVQAMPEEEFLQLIDISLSENKDITDLQNADEHAAAHILTGLESVGFRQLLAQGFDVNNLPMQDPRSRLLAESLAAEQRAMITAGGASTKVGQFSAVARNAGSVSAYTALMAESEGLSMREGILWLIRETFSNLILISPDQVDNGKPLAQFGLDSMLAAEFRTWLWATFKVDVPFLDILSSHKSLDSLAGDVEAKMTE